MKAKLWFGFLALCLLAGSAWLYDMSAPGIFSGLPRTALHNGLVALACAVWAFWRRETSPAPRVYAKLAGTGVMLFALPEIVLAGASSHVNQATEVLVFMLVPVVVVFCVGQQRAGFGTGGEPMLGLVPALAGLGGAALILPFELPSSLAGRLWLVGLVATATAAGVAAVAMHRLLARLSIAWAGGVVFGVSGLLMAGCGWRDWLMLPRITAIGAGFEIVRLVVIDGPILLLGIWLIREMRPVSFSSRLLLVPAVTLLEEIAAERPELGWYGWLGLALTVGAGVLLLRSSEIVHTGVEPLGQRL